MTPHEISPESIDIAPTQDRRSSQLELEQRACEKRLRAAEARGIQLLEVARATLRLYEARSQRDVLLAIEALFANLFATEDLAVYDVGADALRPLTALGAGAQLGAVPHGQGPIGRAAAGWMLLGRVVPLATATPVGARDFGPRIAACVPLSVGKAVIAVVVSLTFAERADPPDTELVERAAHHAGLALWNATIDDTGVSSSRTTRRLM